MVRLIASSVSLLLVLLHLVVSPATANEVRVWVHQCNSTDGNYTSDSTYKANLDTLFTKITTTSVKYGFYNFSAGEAPDVANSISLCEGGLAVDDCHNCQSSVIEQLKGLCPNQKTAIAFSDECMVRYSDQSIFGKLEKQPSFAMIRGLNASNVAEYSRAVNQLLNSLPSKASSGDSQLKFSTGEANINATLTIYAAAQCTPDLSKEDCLDCLNDTISQIHSCCDGQRGARVLLPSCSIRYEEGMFYPAPDSPPTPNPPLKVWVHQCNNTDGIYTSNASYKANLDTLFKKMTSTPIKYGFYNFSAGEDPDVVNSISLCQGGLEVDECHTCQTSVIEQLEGLCPYQKIAIAFSDECMVRYSDQSIFGKLELEPSFPMPRGLKASNLEQYSKVVTQLLQSLPSNASSGDSQLKFSTGEANINDTLKIYAAAQCTPDLSREDCLNCLNVAISEIHLCCEGERGARVLLPSCSVRYEENKFYLSPDAAPSPAVAQSTNGVGAAAPGNSESSKRSLIAFIAAVGASLSVLL